MVRECHNYKRDKKCKFGAKCKYKHVDKPNEKIFEQCLQFISKEGCKGNCFKAHVYPEDFELFDLYKSGVDITHLRVSDLELKKSVQTITQTDSSELDSMSTDYYFDTTNYTLITSQPTPQREQLQQLQPQQPQPQQHHMIPTLDSSRYSGPMVGSESTQSDNMQSSDVNTLVELEAEGFYLPEPVFESTMLPNITTQRENYSLEVKQLERLYRDRFQMCKTDNGTTFQIIMKPSDPDWSLTLLEINLDLFIPCQYPALSCTIEISDERISEVTQRDINIAIKEELSERAGTLCVRPMLRWIDRNIETMLQSEVQFHAFSNLRVYKKGEIEWSGEGSSESDEEGEMPDEAPSTSGYLQTDKGTSIRLISLDLQNTCDGLTPNKLLLLLACLRCKFQGEVLIAPGETKSVDCGKCTCVLTATLHKRLCNTTSSALACAELVGCAVSDLIVAKSRFSSICSGCSADNVMNLYIGKDNNSWCKECGNKISISFESVKLVVITPPTAVTKQKKVVKKEKGCVEGQPLPERGTCKHYKKSERWFRFSCCERIYPCDKCHDAAVPDCPLETANRMVCGLCSKEQAVRNQCKYCHNEISGNLKSTHWEGGKGCRNKMRMDARDDKKHKGSKLKTQCQKSKRVGKQNKDVKATN